MHRDATIDELVCFVLVVLFNMATVVHGESLHSTAVIGTPPVTATMVLPPDAAAALATSPGLTQPMPVTTNQSISGHVESDLTYLTTTLTARAAADVEVPHRLCTDADERCGVWASRKPSACQTTFWIQVATQAPRSTPLMCLLLGRKSLHPARASHREKTATGPRCALCPWHATAWLPSRRQMICPPRARP